MATTDYIIFENQSALEIRLDTEIDISGCTAMKIKYKKPSGTEGEWTATAYDTTTVKYSFTGTELDEDGIWIFWPYVTMADGRVAPGQAVTQRVYAEGETM